jgi:ATP-dependent helicase/nuclease subunit A
VLAFEFSDGGKHKVDEYRELEGRVLARYLRWLVEASGERVADELDGRSRPVRYGDIAVLAVSTWRLPLLFRGLDAEGIPYASRGGTLFLQDPLHRQFLLGLRAVADRDDGVAEAALLRPPFFGVDLLDLLRERAFREGDADPDDQSVSRVREAREIIGELRRRRFDRTPGATARDLLERTAFARAVALGPNGTQRLARLRELCLVLQQVAADQGLDYDAATARLREWVERPVKLDPPHPVGQEAVQVMTVHQAKGLEFPVVAFWDGKGRWDMRPESGAWRMERDGRGWMLNLDGLTWEEPPDLDIRQTEQAYLDAERRRVIYVAATRARDLLIIPRAGDVQPTRFVCGDLLGGALPHLVDEIAPYVDSSKPAWDLQLVDKADAEPVEGSQSDRETGEWWTTIAAEAARPRFQPASVSREATVALDEALEGLEPPRKIREGRFGHLFGTTVHQALGLALRQGDGFDVREAVRRAAQLTGLEEHLDEAIADLTRTLAALQAEGLVRPIGSDLQVEYPVAAAWENGRLLSGYIDLVGATDQRLHVIDLKTDTPPQGMAVDQAYPEYVAQARAYGRLLAMTGILGHRELRCGLLFTADGGIRWLDANAMGMPKTC